MPEDPANGGRLLDECDQAQTAAIARSGNHIEPEGTAHEVGPALASRPALRRVPRARRTGRRRGTLGHACRCTWIDMAVKADGVIRALRHQAKSGRKLFLAGNWLAGGRRLVVLDAKTGRKPAHGAQVDGLVPLAERGVAFWPMNDGATRPRPSREKPSAMPARVSDPMASGPAAGRMPSCDTPFTNTYPWFGSSWRLRRASASARERVGVSRQIGEIGQRGCVRS